MHAKPIGLLNVAGYFDPLLAWLARAVADGFLPDPQRQILQVADGPEALLDMLRHYRPTVSTPKWIEPEER
jgi:predicted Rossmann-fold nucleotide-binding protein